MTALLVRSVCLVVISGTFFHLAAQELPAKGAGEDIEAEAKKLMEDLPNLEQDPADLAKPGEDLDAILERLKGTLDRARQKQQRWEKLAKQGVLSRAEAEGCMVEVADALARHERARVAVLRQQLTGIQERVGKGEADATLAEAAQVALTNATAAADEAEKQAKQTRLNSARNNLDRHRKLFAAGLVSRMQLQRAEEALRRLEDAQALQAVANP
jgi:multidrug resistance efflux pump